MPPMRVLASVAVVALSLPMTGCCSLARLFCGPDRSDWISVDYRTPELAVRTLLEAFRRDDPQIVYLSISNGFRKRLGVDALTAELAWPKIREQNPGLHLAGYAEVPTPTLRGLDRADVVLDIEGNRVELRLVRQSYWEVRYRRPGGGDGDEPAAVGRPIPSFVGFADVAFVEDADDDESKITIEPLTFQHYNLDEVPLANVEFAGLFRRWKVEGLRQLEE